jgi:hypothetical protein
MEFRWLKPDERRGQVVESGSLAEVLELAQKLQAEGEGLLSEEEVIQTGQELGIRPEYVREALALRQLAAQPAQAPPLGSISVKGDERPLAVVGQALLLVFALALFPAAMSAVTRNGMGPLLPLLALIAAIATGWTARYPRLAAIGGALAVPAVLVAMALYPADFYPSHGPDTDQAVFLSLLSFGPLCSVVGRGAAKLRRWTERFTDRPEWIARGS